MNRYFSLGQWAPYVDLNEMLDWYQLPDVVERELSAYTPDGTEMTPLSDEEFARLYNDLVRFVDESVIEALPTYHLPRHFHLAVEEGLGAIKSYTHYYSIALPTLVLQMFMVALYSHDAFHSASTLRKDFPRLLPLADLGVNDAAEWITSVVVNHFLRSYGIPLPARLFVMGIHWASTYGGNTESGRRLGIPTPQPRTVWGAIMRCVDVCPPTDFREWIAQSADVMFGEKQEAQPPQNLTDFIVNRHGFLRYITATFDHLDEVAGMQLAQRCGWRDRLLMIQQGLYLLSTHDPETLGLLEESLSRYGVSFLM